MKWLLPSVVVFLAALFACGCSQGEDQRDLKRKLASPHTQKPTIREMAKKGVPYLKKLLRSRDRLIRNSAITALGLRKDDKEATRLLLGLCEGKDVEDARAALIAIADSRAPQARDLTVRFAASDQPRLRQAACIVIFEYGDESLYPLLDKLVEDSDSGVQRTARRMKERIKRRASRRPA